MKWALNKHAKFKHEISTLARRKRVARWNKPLPENKDIIIFHWNSAADKTNVTFLKQDT